MDTPKDPLLWVTIAQMRLSYENQNSNQDSLEQDIIDRIK